MPSEFRCRKALTQAGWTTSKNVASKHQHQHHLFKRAYLRGRARKREANTMCRPIPMVIYRPGRGRNDREQGNFVITLGEGNELIKAVRPYSPDSILSLELLHFTCRISQPSPENRQTARLTVFTGTSGCRCVYLHMLLISETSVSVFVVSGYIKGTSNKSRSSPIESSR